MMHLSKPPSSSVASLTAKVGTAVEIDDDEQKFPFTRGLGTPDHSTSLPYAISAIQLSPMESRTKSQACLPTWLRRKSLPVDLASPIIPANPSVHQILPSEATVIRCGVKFVVEPVRILYSCSCPPTVYSAIKATDELFSVNQISLVLSTVIPYG